MINKTNAVLKEWSEDRLLSHLQEQIMSLVEYLDCFILQSNQWKALYFINSATDLRSDFVSANDEHNFPAPRIHKTGPAGVQYDIISILSTKSNR